MRFCSRHLRQILASARTITTVPATTGANGNDDSDGDRGDVRERETGAYYVDQIARRLLTASDQRSSCVNNPITSISVQGEHDVIG
jgi:hypothetical protein